MCTKQKNTPYTCIPYSHSLDTVTPFKVPAIRLISHDACICAMQTNTHTHTHTHRHPHIPHIHRYTPAHSHSDHA